ncbi:hypothetical protein [Nocardioides zhouii]|uniref:Lipoprotein n=1 Tax=Nocardioides zhouii TaxID=1168729 RepID=A0A4Q2SFF4_9ACTN|nr:hypothetical protein [Nocardioides zhouii]RYC03852.1 hypothetical protein EUA94_21270 [Nocardioides zhouii]
MRTTLLLLVLATVMSACSTSGGSAKEGGGESVDAVETATTERAQEAIPLVSEALGATAVKAQGQWQSCMAISWRYEAFATITAGEGETAAQLDQVRAALVDAGYDDATKVDGHVAVAQDDTTVDVQPSPARGQGAWTVSVQSSCADYDGDDLERVENDEGRPLEGV